jgi:predicted MFS family arabinose efflux permease
VLLAAVSLIPLARIPRFESAVADDGGDRHRPVTAALVLIVALGLVTLGGSAVFVFSGVIAVEEAGMTPLAVSFVLSANAAAGIPTARWRGRRPLAGAWILAIAVLALLLGLTESAPMFAVVVTTWGFVYWFAIPGVFALLSDRSRHPSERAGDAQAAMAAGRVVGPIVGGIAVNAGSFTTLGALGAVTLAGAGATVLAVELTL